MKNNSVTLSWAQLIALLRFGPLAIPIAVDEMREIYGDSAPQYDVIFSLHELGGVKMSFRNHNAH